MKNCFTSVFSPLLVLTFLLSGCGGSSTPSTASSNPTPTNPTPTDPTPTGPTPTNPATYSEQITVPANYSRAYTTANTESGATYRITVTGVYTNDFSDDGNTDCHKNRLADAAYGSDNCWSNDDPSNLIYGPNKDTKTTNCPLGLRVNGADVNWGLFRADHTYIIDQKASGEPFTFGIPDCLGRTTNTINGFMNNSGSLNVDVSKVDPNDSSKTTPFATMEVKATTRTAINTDKSKYYRITTKGTYYTDLAGGRRIDAYYTSYNDYQYANGAGTDPGSTCPAGLVIDYVAQNWGPYNPEHEYSTVKQGTGAPLVFNIIDCVNLFSDNAGSLEVDVAETDTLEVIQPSLDGNIATSLGSYDPAKTYRVDVSGTYGWGTAPTSTGNPPPIACAGNTGDITGDARYISDDWWATDGVTTIGSLPAPKLQVNGQVVNWGDFNKDHVYSTSVAPNPDGSFTFQLTGLPDLAAFTVRSGLTVEIRPGN